MPRRNFRELEARMGPERIAASNARVRDFLKLLKDVPPGAWVALSHDEERVVSFGADMRDVVKDAHDQGESDPIILRAPNVSLVL